MGTCLSRPFDSQSSFCCSVKSYLEASSGCYAQVLKSLHYTTTKAAAAVAISSSIVGSKMFECSLGSWVGLFRSFYSRQASHGDDVYLLDLSHLSS